MASEALNQAMDILKSIRQITEGNASVKDKLFQIIKILTKKTNSDASACYISVEDNYLELFVSVSLKKHEDEKVSIRLGESLTGEIAKTNRFISTTHIDKHPKFKTKEELNESKFNSFLGVPLIQRSRNIGVITLYRKKSKEYSVLEVEIIETVAMVLSELVGSDEIQAYKKNLIKERGLSDRERVKGLSLSKGYGLGNAVVHRRHHAVTKIFAEDKDKEIRKLEVAYHQMNSDLDEKFATTKLGLGEHTEILDAYKMFAKDKGWYKKIEDNVKNGLTAEAAVERAYEDMWNRMSGTTDSYLKERLHDLRDVADRLQSYISGDYGLTGDHIESDSIIVVAQAMGPADLMDYEYHKIKGLIIEEGTPTMHVAIVAKALNIPVIAKTRGLFDEIKNGQLVAVDGNDGYVYVNPSQLIEDRFKAKIAEKEKLQAQLAELRTLPSKTVDGVKVNLYINVGLAFDLDYIKSTNCDGVGLYRTEIPFMASESMPNVDKQISYYKELMDKAGDKKVIFRSLDVGSDKLLPYWSSFGEENPAIGWRSIRITLDRRAILKQQIRAFLRASANKELNIMFPMISDVSEFEDAKETLLLELEKEKKKGNPSPKKLNIGLMIEVPSVLYQLDTILKTADFISVGTNDLAQFIFASDRGNSKLTDRYDVLSSSFLKVMNEIVEKANKHNVYCSVCGEMASNPIEAMALIGLGYRHLSTSGSSFGKVKSMVRSSNISEVSEYVRSLLNSPKKTLRPQLMAYAYDHGIEIY